ncbi:hypothetical protein [Trichormus sp. NMC-1]|uniref:hypothetical protein n=1 Tax=Trichormus sp. NMC-1 TaxID=1853259 RepID=UPI00115FC14A|nr:hypothetical protein [Trichormus sp. NMC-1]
MQTLINNKNRSKNKILVTVLTSLFYLPMNVDKALSGGGDATQSTTEQASVTSSATQSAGSLTVTPTTLLQTGSNNYANVNSNTGSLNYPNCGGTCSFAIMRTTPTNNLNGTGGNQIEGVIGVIHSFSSPDQTNAETNRQLVDIQKQRSESEITSNYIKIIADACQAKDLIRAELNAKGLARIWNVDYKTLLHPSCG